MILYGSRAKGTARERSDIDIAVSGVENFNELVEKAEELPTLYSVDIVNMDTCKISYYWRISDSMDEKFNRCLLLQVHREKYSGKPFRQI